MAEKFLLEVIDRSTRKGLCQVVERELERRPFEGDSSLIDRMKRTYLAEVENNIKHMPVVRRKLQGQDWCIDCVLL